MPIFHPRTQAWHDHFALVGLEILGTTPTGRATAHLLSMNDPERPLQVAELRQYADYAVGRERSRFVWLAFRLRKPGRA